MASQKVLEHYLRQLRLIEEHREKWCEQNVRRHTRDLMTDLQEFFGVEYAQLAQDDKLTYEILHSKGQYARFIEEAEQRITKYNSKVAQEIRNVVQMTYNASFKGMVDAVEKSKDYAELKTNLAGVRAVTPDIIKNAVSNTFLEDALEKNHKTNIYNIKQQIGIGLSQGDRMSTMARRVSEQLNKDQNKAIQIIRTETHRVREAGYQDSSERISQILKDDESDYVMTKTWKTMQDGAVRPQRPAGKKSKKTFKMGTGPNHVKMHGVTVLVEDFFDLGNGVKAKTPGQSGVAGHDINCRCYLSRDFMTIEEYEKLTGKKVTGREMGAQKYENEEQILLNEKSDLESEKTKIEKRKENLESYEYEGIWKDKVTPADYELKKGSIQAKRDYYNDEINKAKNRTGKYATFDDIDVEMHISRYEEFLSKLDEFEAQGKTHLKLTKQLSKIDDRLLTIDDDIKDVRQKIMKAKKIDPDKMQKEIDDLIGEINKLSGATNKATANLTLKSKVKDFHGELEEATKNAGIPDYKPKFHLFEDDSVESVIDFTLTPEQQTKFKKELKKLIKNDTDYSSLYDYDLGFDFKGIDYFTDKDAKADIDDVWKSLKNMPKKAMDSQDKETYNLLKSFFDDLDDLQDTSGNTKKLKKLQKQLQDKQDELEKIKKRYGLIDDAFSQARKDKAYWFTDKNGGGEGADKVLRDKCGEVWRNAKTAQKKSAYEYTQSYHKYNEPLRGIEYGTNKFLGVGKVDLDDIGVSTGYGMKKGQVKKLIDDLTDIIDESSYDFDVWLQRGCRYNGMDKFFNVGPDDFATLTEKQMQAKLLGTTPTEFAFMSTGVAKGKGLNLSGQGITLNLYAPKGTKMLYCEPFSAFGHGDGLRWDGVSKQSFVGYEAEVLLQRNTKFRVTKVEKSGSRWFIDMEIIGQKR